MKEWDDCERRLDDSDMARLKRNPIIIAPGQVLYDPKVNKFLRIRETGIPYCVCSDYCDYYEDTGTTIHSIRFPVSYLEALIRVVSPVEHPDICEWDGYGWRVKKTSYGKNPSSKGNARNV